MDPGRPRRASLIACMNCGHRIGNIGICDAQFKCKQCGCEFEVVIMPLRDPGTSARNIPPAKEA